MNIVELIEEAKRKTGSDNRTEDALELGSGTLNNYRKGRPPEPEIAARLAAFVGADPTEAILSAVKERARTAAGRALLMDLLRKHTASAKHAWGALVLAALLGGQSGTADAATFNKTVFSSGPEYTLSLLRRLMQRLTRRRVAQSAPVLHAPTNAQAAA